MALVLVVEDDRDQGVLFKRTLERLGHEVVLAREARAALRVAKSRQPDLVFADLSLPGMSGLELAKRLGMLKIPVVGVTAHSVGALQHEALASGMRSLEAKPLGSQRLTTLMEVATSVSQC